MIFKSDLVEAINSISDDLEELTIRVSKLEEKIAWQEEIKWVKNLKKPSRGEKKTELKRKPGRPRKA